MAKQSAEKRPGTTSFWGFRGFFTKNVVILHLEYNKNARGVLYII